MNSKTICRNSWPEEDVKVLVTSYTNARLPSTDKQYITDVVINNLPLLPGFCISVILATDLVYPSCSSV